VRFRRNGLAILLAALMTATLLAALAGLIRLIRRLILLVVALATAAVLTTLLSALLLILVAHESFLFILAIATTLGKACCSSKIPDSEVCLLTSEKSEGSKNLND
jgi:hypothetical protein